jgi:hypothetical protein
VIAGTVYCIDTSAILEARVRAYPPDHFVQLWNNIEELIAVGRLIAAEEVRVELGKKADDAFNWAKQQPGLFVPFNIDQSIR